MLGQRIAARQPPPTCLPELRRALLDEWCNIPQDQIVNLILSMPRRFQDFGYNMSLRIHFLDSRLNFFPDNCRQVSDEHSKPLHQDFTSIEKLHQGNWSMAILGYYCWMLIRDASDIYYK
ncbi:uncharacterized protein TNCV_213371 [Trichonephila clavipes]|nr:uncharacterized protein TNCV_213371 [Trichonephila clavipes]